MPRLVETKHIKHRLLRVGNGALFCSLKYISSTLRFCAGGSFFLPSGRLVRRLFSFHFPVAGWLRELNKNPKRSQTWPTRKTPLPASAKVPIRELCTTPSPRARVRTHAWLDKRKRVYILIILYPQTTRTRVRTRETHGVRSLRMR